MADLLRYGRGLFAEHPGPAALRFLDMIGSNAMEPLVIARTTAGIR